MRKRSSRGSKRLSRGGRVSRARRLRVVRQRRRRTSHRRRALRQSVRRRVSRNQGISQRQLMSIYAAAPPPPLPPPGVQLSAPTASVLPHFDYASAKQRGGGKLYLEGPTCVYEFKSKPESGLNKHIYLFGDFHPDFHLCRDETASNYVQFPQFLNDAFLDNPDKIIDVLTENKYYTQRFSREYHEIFLTKRRKSVIDALDLYLDCYRPLHQFDQNVAAPPGCRYPNIRYHKTDVRDMFETEHPRFESFLKDINEYYGAKTVPEQNQIERALIPKYVNLEFIQYVTAELRTAFAKYKVEKQLQNVRTPRIRNLLLNYRQAENARLGQYYNAFMTHVRTNPPEALSNLSMYYKQSAGLIMDLYLLGRLFRTFKNGAEINNAVILTGSIHTMTYKNFIEKTGMFDRVFQVPEAELKYKGEDGFEQCIDISRLKIPLFR